MALMIFVFSMVVGIGLCIYLVFRTKKIRFSLQTIFVMVTASCLALAMSAAFGLEMLFYIAGMLFGLFLPLANLAIIGMVVVTIVNTRGERQAVQIGRLTPLIALAILDITRGVGFAFAFPQPGIHGLVYATIFGGFYLAAWGSGFASRHAYFALAAEQRREPASTEPIRTGAIPGREWHRAHASVASDPQVM